MSQRECSHELIVGMSSSLKSYHRRKQRVIDEGKKRREEVKREFEEYLIVN